MAISRRIGILGALLLMIGGLIATPAYAHTTLVRSDPARNATATHVTRVTLTYADPVIVPRVVVRDANGTNHVAGQVHATANRVVAHLTAPLPAGSYTVGWRVVAPDGHPVTGEFRFTVRATASSPATAPSTTPTQLTSTPVSNDSGSSFSWGWLFVIVLLVGVVFGVVATILRRRRTPPPTL